MSKTLENKEIFCRMLDGSGNLLSSTGGALNSTVSFPSSLDISHAVLDQLSSVDGKLQVSSRADLYVDNDPVSGSNKVPVECSGSVGVSTTPVVGSHGNCFNVQTSTIFDVSTGIDCQYCSTISAFGSVNGTGTSVMKLQYSQENSVWADSGLSATITNSGDFNLSTNACGARYCRLQHSGSADLILIGTIAGK